MTGPEFCDKCKGLHFKTAPCIIRKSSGGSSEAEHRPSKSGVEGSIPSRRSKETVSRNNVAKPPLPRKQVPAGGAGAGSPSPARPVPHKDVIVGSNPTPATVPKRIDTRKGDRHRPGYWRDYFRARKAKLKAEREEK